MADEDNTRVNDRILVQDQGQGDVRPLHVPDHIEIEGANQMKKHIIKS